MSDHEPSHSPEQHVANAGWWVIIVEVAAIVGLFVIIGGSPTPGVNEAHYLAKAKHYWDPLWLEGDVFLESDDAHAVFYWTFGWLTLLFPLPVVAWIGRFLTWTLLAWSWRRLSWRLIPRPWIAMLTAALFALGVEHLHMAGEWIIGGVEAKGFAYVCVLLGLHALSLRHWGRAWMLFGCAAAFHVLVGGWAVVAVGFAWLVAGKERPTPMGMLPAIGVAFCISLASLAPALLLSRGDAESTALANSVYVWYRLPHHLLFHQFDHWFIARHALLLVGVALAAFCLRKNAELEPGQRYLAGFVGGCVLLTVAGAVIDQALLHDRDLANSLLRFYWFRLSDVMLPAAGALLLVMGAMQLARTEPRLGRAAVTYLVLLAGVGMAYEAVRQQSDIRPRADAQTLPTFEDNAERTERIYRDWRRMCAWVGEHTPNDALFLTPRRQQTFKWYAQRKEVVSWKDVPQDTAGIVDWWDRFGEVHAYRLSLGGLAGRNDGQLSDLAEKYGADYVVIDRTFAKRPIGLERVYPRWPEVNGTYEVYRVERDE